MQTKGRLIKEVEADSFTLQAGAVGMVRSREASLKGGGAGAVLAQGDVDISQGGASAVISAGDVSFRYGGTNSVLAAGNVSFEYGGAMSTLARSATVGQGGIVGILCSGRTTVQEGAKVLMSTPQAAALGAGIGLVLGLFGWARSRRNGDESEAD